MRRGVFRRRRRVFFGGDGIVRDGLVAEWRFNEGTGTTAADSSGNGYNLTSLGGSWIAGGFLFSSSKGPGSNMGLTGAAAKSFVMAIRTEAGTVTENRIGNRFLAGAGSNIWVGPRHPGGGEAGATLRINNGATQFTSTLDIDLGATEGGVWHFLAITDRGTNLNTTTLYLNADSQAVTSSSTLDHTGNFVIAHNNSGDVAQAMGYLLAYDRELDAGEIAQNRTALAQIMLERGIVLPGFEGESFAFAEQYIENLAPVGWYKFNEGAGSTVTDYGSAGADLALSGSGGAWVTGGHDSDGTAWWDAASGLGITGTDARTVLVACAPQAAPATNHIMSVEWIGAGVNGQRWTLRQDPNDTFLRLEIAGEGYSDSNNTLVTLANGTWALVGASMSAAGNALEDCQLYANGNAEDAVGAVVTINTQGDFQVGTFGTTGLVNWLVGYVLVFDYELSASQFTNVRTALTTIMAARGITLP